MLRPVLFLIAFMSCYLFQWNLNTFAIYFVFANAISDSIMKQVEDEKEIKKRFSSKKKKTSKNKRNKQGKSVTRNNSLDVVNMLLSAVHVCNSETYCRLRPLTGEILITLWESIVGIFYFYLIKFPCFRMIPSNFLLLYMAVHIHWESIFYPYEKYKNCL